MQKISRNERRWLIFFTLILIAMIGGCVYETVAFHKPIGPRPIIKNENSN